MKSTNSVSQEIEKFFISSINFCSMRAMLASDARHSRIDHVGDFQKRFLCIHVLKKPCIIINNFFSHDPPNLELRTLIRLRSTPQIMQSQR
jgi:hypothetical protein